MDGRKLSELLAAAGVETPELTKGQQVIAIFSVRKVGDGREENAISGYRPPVAEVAIAIDCTAPPTELSNGEVTLLQGQAEAL